MSRNIWIDLGSYQGEITRRFMASELYQADFELHAFEPNPFLVACFPNYPGQVVIHPVAAWISDGTIDFYLNWKRPISVSASIRPDKRTGRLDIERPIQVPSCDLARWIIDNFEADDNLIVKCNIEGAEYELFRHLVETGAIHYIKRLYLRCHRGKLSQPLNVHRELMRQLRAVDTMTFFSKYEF